MDSKNVRMDRDYEADREAHRGGFDKTIGQLDRILSVLIHYSSSAFSHLDSPDLQTLKHHAEDMVGAGNKILENLKNRT